MLRDYIKQILIFGDLNNFIKICILLNILSWLHEFN